MTPERSEDRYEQGFDDGEAATAAAVVEALAHLAKEQSEWPRADAIRQAIGAVVERFFEANP